MPKSKINDPSYILLVDSREPPKVVADLEDEGLTTEVVALPVGDFVLGKVCFERKEISDFVNSVKKGHLNKQLLQMEQNYDLNYLIIIGDYMDLHWTHQQWSVAHHLGSLASITVRFPSVRILTVANNKQMASIVSKLILKIYDHKRIGILDTELVKPMSLLRDCLTARDMQIKMLRCLPGIGNRKAAKLLENDAEMTAALLRVIDRAGEAGIWKPKK